MFYGEVQECYCETPPLIVLEVKGLLLCVQVSPNPGPSHSGHVVETW